MFVLKYQDVTILKTIPARCLDSDAPIKMQKLANKSYLYTYSYWSKYIDICNETKGGSELEHWKVYFLGNYVSCTSELMANKIAYTAAQVINRVKYLDNQTKKVLDKVCTLLNCSEDYVRNDRHEKGDTWITLNPNILRFEEF